MFAVWLLFDDDCISQIIKNLSERYDSPAFVPHITIYGLVNTNKKTIEKAILDSIKTINSFTVEKNTISCSDNIWKTIFIEIKLSDYLKKINKKLTEHLMQYNKYEFDPHISLIYKKMNLNEKQKLVNNLNVGMKFKINRICIQQFSENIEEWKIIQEYQLKS